MVRQEVALKEKVDKNRIECRANKINIDILLLLLCKLKRIANYPMTTVVGISILVMRIMER